MNGVDIQQFDELRRYVNAEFGLYYSNDRMPEFQEKLKKILVQFKIETPKTLIDRLADSLETRNALISELTIGETYFFRNEPHFLALESKVIPELIEKNRNKQVINIWSAGCASGEEPYSIAMMLLLKFPQLASWQINIMATDINEEFLTRARKGVYGRWSFRRVDPVYIQRFFKAGADSSSTLSDEVKQMVQFRTLNLAKLPYPTEFAYGAFDLILCRNVLIYFAVDTIEKVIWSFFSALSENGYLFVGHSESFNILRIFNAIYTPGTFFYQKYGKAIPQSQATKHPTPFGLRELANISLSNPGIAPEPSNTPSAGSKFKKPLVAPKAVPPPTPKPGELKPAVASITSAKTQSENLYKRARSLADSGEFEKARDILLELVKENGNDVKVHFLLALTAEQLMMISDAKKHLKAAIFLDKGFVIGHYTLGVLYERSGEVDTARRYYHNALKLLDATKDNMIIYFGEELQVKRFKEILVARIKELEVKSVSVS